MNLTLTQYRALVVIAETASGQAATVEIAYGTGIKNSTARNMLARMARAGLVAPITGSARVYLYRITPAGRKAIEP